MNVDSGNIFTASQKLSVSAAKDMGNQNRIRLDGLAKLEKVLFSPSSSPTLRAQCPRHYFRSCEVYIVVFLENPNENTKLLKSFRASEFA